MSLFFVIDFFQLYRGKLLVQPTINLWVTKAFFNITGKKVWLYSFGTNTRIIYFKFKIILVVLNNTKLFFRFLSLFSEKLQTVKTTLFVNFEGF